MTIKMQNGDRFADVHPDEVENYRAGGFEVVDHPLDHDGDGKPGGSVAGFHATASKGVRRRKEKAK
jgi:hypothetical protein